MRGYTAGLLGCAHCQPFTLALPHDTYEPNSGGGRALDTQRVEGSVGVGVKETVREPPPPTQWGQLTQSCSGV